MSSSAHERKRKPEARKIHIREKRLEGGKEFGAKDEGRDIYLSNEH